MSGIIAQNAANATGLIKAAAGGGAWTKLATSTASTDASISFASNIDSTYPIYKFEFINIHPVTDSAHFQINFRDGGSNYDATKTTTAVIAYHQENDGDQNWYYLTGLDLAQSTSVQKITGTIGNLNDESFSGELWLFNPASTTFVKHFICRGNTYSQDSTTADMYFAGYCNVTAAIDGVQFTMSSDEIQSGTIKMYGLGDS
jgi:hypothetical protein